MIDNLFDHYRRKCETDVAASILTLAAVLNGQQDQILTVKEAAAALKCSEDAIYQQCEAGKLPHKRVGRMIRIRESDLRNSA
jgi:excisionase family DNA binding protein